MTRKKIARWIGAVILFYGAMPMTVSAAEVPLIPRDVLFGNPDKAAVRISPDGKHLSWIAPVDGVLNVWVAPVNDLEAGKPITNDTKRGIRSYAWTFNSQNLVYLQDEGGDENWHIHSVDIDTKKAIDLTPFKEVAATIENASPKFPDELLIGINDRDPQLHDTYRVNVKTGNRELVLKNPGFAQVVSDDDFRIRFAMKMNPKDGSTEIFQPDDKGEWKPFDNIPMEDSLTTSPVDFDKSGQAVYLLDSRGRDTAALVKLDPKSKATEVIASNEKADISDVMIHPITKVIEAVATTYERTEWQFFDKGIEEDFKSLEKLADGEIGVSSRTLDDRHWIASIIPDDGPVRYYLFDRKTKEAKFLFTNRADLEKVKLSKMHPVVIKARDGLNLVSYLTLPPGANDGKGITPSKPLPMVLDVHGGPWARDDWGLNPTHQWLANRGYAVLSVNFRGSTGFGKRFINAGNHEWAAKM
ncbi:prolyl oligopeptidase family serine peptidase, partial [bacterium]|nr:prolyl oligopeptidase family serine peptidase [bacterium]